MNTIPTVNMPPLSCEIEEDMEILSASPKDWDLAQKVNPSIKQNKEGIYSDGEYDYYSLTLPVKIRGLGTRIAEKQVWIRSTVKMIPGGFWEPDDYDEVLVDGDRVFLSLSDAVKMSKLDSYRRELAQMDNDCYSCMGCGCDGLDEKPCTKCGGTGFIK